MSVTSQAAALSVTSQAPAMSVTSQAAALSVTSQAPFTSSPGQDNVFLAFSSLWVNASLTSPRSEVESETGCCNVTGLSVAEVDVWAYSSGVRLAATVAVAALCGAALLLNALLALTIQFSPSLKTPPNSHLLNICCNNFALTVHMLMAMPSLHLNGLDVQQKGSEILSGLQLFLLMHCLFQYWGAFASIGYYRFRTICKPSLSLRVRKQLVSRSITVTWVISLMVAMTFSLTTSLNSAYLPWTLDPFRANYALKRLPGTGAALPRKEEESLQKEGYEQIVVMSLVVGGLVVGLVIILKSYYSICRTLNLTGSVGRNRVSPWPVYTSTLTATPCDQQVGPPTLDISAASAGSRAHRPNQEGLPFCVSIPPAAESDQWVVHYQKCDHSAFIDGLLTMEKPRHKSSSAASFKRSLYAGKRPLTGTFSNGSTLSVGKGSCNGNSIRHPDFSDISLGAEIIRLQRMQCRSALSKQTVRRERGSLNSASKNSLAMLVAFLLCSLPLIVCQVPGVLSDVKPERRIVVLLVCRVLFFLNAPVYPMWYLLFSHRVKKCLTRMCESFLIRIHFRQ